MSTKVQFRVKSRYRRAVKCESGAGLGRAIIKVEELRNVAPTYSNRIVYL
jgi:hypothetical protein